MLRSFRSSLHAARAAAARRPVDDSPEGQAVPYRQSVMRRPSVTRSTAVRADGIGGSPRRRGQVPQRTRADVADARWDASRRVHTQQLRPRPEQCKYRGLDRHDRFQQKAADLRNAARRASGYRRVAGFEAAKGMVQAVGSACGAAIAVSASRQGRITSRRTRCVSKRGQIYWVLHFHGAGKMDLPLHSAENKSVPFYCTVPLR